MNYRDLNKTLTGMGYNSSFEFRRGLVTFKVTQGDLVHVLTELEAHDLLAMTSDKPLEVYKFWHGDIHRFNFRVLCADYED